MGNFKFTFCNYFIRLVVENEGEGVALFTTATNSRLNGAKEDCGIYISNNVSVLLLVIVVVVVVVVIIYLLLLLLLLLSSLSLYY